MAPSRAIRFESVQHSWSYIRCNGKSNGHAARKNMKKARNTVRPVAPFSTPANGLAKTSNGACIDQIVGKIVSCRAYNLLGDLDEYVQLGEYWRRRAVLLWG
jgi:hypothetical protein